MESATEHLTPAELVERLQALTFHRLTLAGIAADIDDGAPINPDGTLDPARYLAWLLHENRDGET